MKYILLLSNLFVTLFLCSQPENMDKSVRPQDDFYNYVNGTWMKKTEIPGDRGRWGSFDQLREDTDKECLKLMNHIITSEHAKDSETQKIKDFYLTILDTTKRNTDGLKPLKAQIDMIDVIQNKVILQKYLEKAGLDGSNPLFNVYVDVHMKKSQYHTLYLGAANLGLGRDYFQKNDERSLEVQQEYKKYIKTLLYKIQPELINATPMVEDIFHFEKMMADQLLTVEDIRNSELQYNIVAVNQLNTISRFFDLPSYIESFNLRSDSIIIPEIKFFKNLDILLEGKSMDFFKYYLKFKALNGAMTVLSSDLDSIQFDFYGKFLNGQLEQRSREKRALETINYTYGEILGKSYIKKNFPPSAKADMLELVSYLKKSFQDRITNLKWMSPVTKAKALDKLDKMTVKIGYPDKWKDYSDARVTSTRNGGSYYSNARDYSIWSTNENLKKLNKPVDRTEWGMNPQTVNAYYNPSYNEIVFPAAILQSPFYSLKANPAYNFGGIGGVIGHEISHGFDDGGSQYDGDGNLKDWWTEEDKKKFQVATKALEAQFNAYEPIPKMFVNGKFTLGENIADLAGVSVAFQALRMYSKDHPQIKGKETYTEKDFFLSWATIWRSKMRDKFIANMIKTDPHSPGNFRAIGPLVNLDAFYEIFNVKEGDKLYKKPEERIVIW